MNFDNLIEYVKERCGMIGCNMTKFDCDKYLDCDICLVDKLNAYKKEIRVDVIKEVNAKIDEYIEKSNKIYEIEIIEMYSDVVCDLQEWIAEQLKEHNQ